MNALAGTENLIRLIVRRDRWLLLAWIVVVGLIPIGIAASAAGLYTTPEALKAYADESMSTASAIAMLGPVFAPTLGGMIAWRSGLQSAILIAPVAIFFAIRHTRSEEENGRRELVGATVVGRQAPLAATFVVLSAASLLIGAIIAGGLIGLGLPVAGSIALGLSATAAGCTFSAIAGITAQLSQSAGAARGIALLVFGLLYITRAIGEIGGLNWLTWLSPVGWLRQTRAFAGEQWWVFAMFVALLGVLVAGAYMLSARRDLGAGLLPTRPGKAAAAPWLKSPLGLAWRLQGKGLLSWAAGLVALGGLFGAVSPSLGAFVNVPQVQGWVTAMGAANAGEAFFFTIIYIIGQVTSVYAILAALRLRSEESAGRADPLLAMPVSRLRWATSHLVFAFGGPLVILLAFGLPLGLIYGMSVGDVGYQLPRIIGRTLAVLPAVWVMAGIATTLYGLRPRLAWLGTWGLLALFLLLELGWEMRQISQAVFDISPFAYVHWTLPVSITPLVGLTCVAAILTVIGLATLRLRDVG